MFKIEKQPRMKNSSRVRDFKKAWLFLVTAIIALHLDTADTVMDFDAALNLVPRLGVVQQTVRLLSGLFHTEHQDEMAISVARQGLDDIARTLNCSDISYRRIDGICNNILKPRWGATLHTQQRLLPNAYMDGLGIPRMTSSTGHLLHSPRTISVECFPPSRESAVFLDHDRTQMVFQFGQFIDHDIVNTLTTQATDCCSETRNGIHHDTFTGGPCFPIPIEPGDRYFTTSCMNFKRSVGIKSSGMREQLNSATSFVDAGTVYGASESQMKKLRKFEGGELQVTEDNMLPLSDCYECVKVHIQKCPYAGDSRVSEFPGLTALHTMFHREHNRIARGLRSFNLNWDDERLFWVTRKIIIAQYQKIVYKDWLPLILGPDVMTLMGLDSEYVYDSNVDASAINEFAAAAFRFGHSMIPDVLRMHRGKPHPVSELLFRFENVLYHGERHLGDIILNQARSSTQRFDQYFSTQISDLLFQGVPHEGGENESFDLTARNIQRGRDHGLPPYFRYFEHSLQRLQGIRVKGLTLPTCYMNGMFESLSDIDLYVGGIYETPLPGAVVGPTFAYIIGEQFRRLRSGDRFFYQTTDPELGFTAEQLAEIEKTTLSAVICRNSVLEKLQPDIFHRPKAGNQWRSCRSYPDIDLSLWKEPASPT